MSILAAKVTQEQGKADKISVELEATELSSIAEQPVLDWLVQLSPAFDQILEELNEMDEKTLKTEEKLKSLAVVAEKRLKKKVDTSQASSSISTTSGSLQQAQQSMQTSSAAPTASSGPVRFKYGFGK